MGEVFWGEGWGSGSHKDASLEVSSLNPPPPTYYSRNRDCRVGGR